jgi:hypothetical protein
MRRRPGDARVPGMTSTARRETDDMTLWTDFVVAGQRVYIRTRRPLRLPRELRESAGEKGADPSEPELRTVVPEAE